MKNNVIIFLLVVLIGVLSGTGLLLGVGNAMKVAMMPLVEKAEALAAKQNDIGRKLDAINVRLAALEKRPSPGQPPPSEDLNKVYTIPVGNSVVVGKKDAPVTIVQFTDLQCPFCARFYPPIKEALKAYPDKVNFIIKHFPLGFHPNARPAAKVAMAAHEQGKYIEMVELLLANGANVSADKMKEYVKQLGLNEQRLMDDLKNKDAQYEAQIKADMGLGTQVDVRGTPTFYMNGKKTMARDFNSFKAQIDAFLAGK
ncbi:MAG: thioredoxin domain-containing protein [Candidatus Omnitrophica bacterium]|nr:thioredoxin domain-containing protein [Candidatus Omnitrophota bacterium]